MDLSKEIPLTKGKIAIVDDEDYTWLSQWRWCTDGRYAIRGIRVEKTKVINIFMHKIIMGVADSQIVDHINGNSFDNRRCNLRFATPAQNQRNTKLSRISTTGYKGVTKHKGKYQAQIRAGGEKMYLGRFDTPEEAALAYNEAALKYHKEFARINELEVIR